MVSGECEDLVIRRDISRSPLIVHRRSLTFTIYRLPLTIYRFLFHFHPQAVEGLDNRAHPFEPSYFLFKIDAVPLRVKMRQQRMFWPRFADEVNRFRKLHVLFDRLIAD